MAEGVASSVLEKLSAPLIEEAFLLCGVRGQVDWLLSEMRWMESFLKVADAKRRNGDELAKNWVREVRNVAHQAEDIIDIFMLEIEPRRRLQRRSGGPIMGRIIRYAAFPFELRARHKVGAGIKELRAKIEQIKASRDRYDPASLDRTTVTGEASRSPADGALQARRRISPYYVDVDDDNDGTIVVGLDVHKKAIIEQLLDANIRRRCVISIVGPGGIGKTTLAKMVFNSSKIRTSFDTTRACVSVSQDYRAGELLKSIAKQVMGTSTYELKSMEMDDLKKALYNFLKARRYFVVLDDLWNRDACLELTTRDVLPDMKNGSRVLVTTRSTEVAESADPHIQPYQLPFLSEEKSWELFLKKAFPAVNQDDHVCPQELEDIGRRLMKRCGGLPLALVVLGGLLSRKDSNPATWKTVAERMNWASTQDGEDCLKILALSYDDLPHHHLRSCFLYLAAFPEDSDIYIVELIPLWIAEGFIQRTGTRTVEETATYYLEELVRRSMIQVRDLVGWGEMSIGGICRIHDLFRDLCIREAKEDGFLRVYNTTDQDRVMRHDHTLRRLALHNISTINSEEDLCPPSKLRSLLAFQTDLNSSEIFNGLNLLRVIHLDGLRRMEILTEEMKSMIHLRYLNMGYCDSLTELPSFIGNLCNLQALVAINTEIRRLPRSIGKIQTLRYLSLPFTCECPPSIGDLTNLHTLIAPSARGGWIEQRGLEKLVNIQMLGVSELMATQGEVFIHSLLKLKRLSCLILVEVELISTEFLTGLSNHNDLRWLALHGPISQRQLLPTNNISPSGFPPNLTGLVLNRSELERDPMPTLEKLPNLVSLTLMTGSYTGKEMICTTGGFPKLQSLSFNSLKELQDWRVEGGAMPQLTKLRIVDCWRLTMLPEGLVHVTSLKYLDVVDEREEFRGRLQPNVGNDWDKIRHVRYISVNARRPSPWS